MQYFEESFMEESFEEASGTKIDQTQSTVPATSNSNSTGQKPTNQKDEASKLSKLPIYKLFFFLASYHTQIPTSTIILDAKLT